MSTCAAGICAPLGSPEAQPKADSPLTSPPANALPPASFPPPPPSDTTVPPIASDPPPTDSQPSPATPSSTQTPHPPPISQKSTPNSSAKSPPPPPVLEWSSSSSSKSSNSPSTELSNVSIGVIAGVVVGGIAILAILGIFLMCCARKKRRDQIAPKGYYVAPPPGKDGNNSGHMQYYQQSNPPSSEHNHVSSLPPPPGYGGFRPPPPHLASRNSSMPPDSFMTGGNSGPTYKGPNNSNSPLSGGVGLSFSKSSFSYEELAMATNGFSSANYLGQGGFGSVHKGVLQDGREVAIKSLKADSGQGEREFQAEIDVISRVHHKHLVTLVGYCITGNQRMLVYEFVANKTLEFHLYGKGRPTMNWPTRLKIALGTAKGLAYLHEDCNPKIIHRDIKGANILIDFQFEAKVADFGLAKFTEDANTHVSTRVMGTFGYLAPEYASSGKLTEKSDVFSFGVMLLEFITGRRPVDRTKSYTDDSLLDWARPYLDKAMEDGRFEPLVDPNLQNNYNHDEMARMVACAAGATSHSAKRRPKMSQIVRALDSSLSLSDLNDGMAPGESRAFGSKGSPEYPSGQYKEDMKRFKKIVLQNQDTASTEYTTGTTSECSVAHSDSTSGSHTTQEMEMAKVRKDGRSFNGSRP